MKFSKSALRMMAVGHTLPLLPLLCPGRGSGILLPLSSAAASPAEVPVPVPEGVGAAGDDATRLGRPQPGGHSFDLGGIGGDGDGDGPERVRVRKAQSFDHKYS